MTLKQREKTSRDLEAIIARIRKGGIAEEDRNILHSVEHAMELNWERFLEERERSGS